MKRCLEMIDEQEFEEDRAYKNRLNAIHDVLFDTFNLFGITPANLRSLVDIHSVLRSLDSEFDACALISTAA